MNNDPEKSTDNPSQKAVDIYRSEGLLSLISRSIDYFKYNVIKPVKGHVMSIGDRLKIFGPDQIYKEDYYAKRKSDPWRSESNHIGEVLLEYFQPKSVIDFGCAIGAHLEPFYEQGIDIQGLEGNQKAIEHSVIPQEKITQHDLREPYAPPKQFDLAISIEVAEHIPEQFADTYVDTISSSADKIMMTAAPPGQGGTHHVNEQLPEYWIDQFEKRGFSHSEEVEKDLTSLIDVENSTWVEENMLVFEKDNRSTN